MRMNLKHSTMKSEKLDDSLRALVLEYIKVHNSGNHSKAEEILHEINTFKKLCDDTKS